MIETTLILKDNLPDNPYIRLHMILDMLENVDEDYVETRNGCTGNLNMFFMCLWN